MENERIYTLITGASLGLGKSLALECAKRGRNLILLSLPNEGLQLFTTELEQTFSIDCKAFELDLTQADQLRTVATNIVNNFRIDLLINNAGLGGTRSLGELSVAELDSMLLLNIRSMVVLTQELLPVLSAESKAYILNISSMAAFGYIPFKGVYPASKAFVSSFSKSLRSELSSTNISVSVAYPGGMLTKPSIAERVKGYNRVIQSTFLSPEYVAHLCLKRCLKGRFRIIPGIMNKFCRLLLTFAPEWLQIRLFNQAMETEFKAVS